jgi:hypothetical protein
MMMTDRDDGWREIYRTDDAGDARMLATSIAAMEFDVRVRALRSGLPLGEEPDPPGPYVVEAHADEAMSLREVVDEIVHEQRSFDEALNARDDRAFQARRVVLLAFAIIIMILVALQLLRL